MLVKSARVCSLLIYVALTAVLGCRPSGSVGYGVGPSDTVPVVATYSILADWVHRVGGDRVRVTTLVGVGGDTHTYEPTPQDSVALTKAAIVFENGLEYEGWLDDLFQSSRSQARRVAVTRDISPRRQRCQCHDSECDPHVWHSIGNAISMVGVIADELSQADPDHAADYRRRAQEYTLELKELDSEIRQYVDSIPQQNRTLVVGHNSFGYFADDYGFQVLSLLDSFSSEATDPSAMKLGSLIRRIRELELPSIFAENTLDAKLTEQVAREAGVGVVAALYTDALGPADSPAATYVSMMRHNAKTIAESLR
ncbi:MAG: zinc ABC transporter substrate-binding protein [Pirellulaceae bacterium]|nr:zinc ABC transporter substrate-binding protein [Pirellulaceae bacterium]